MNFRCWLENNGPVDGTTFIYELTQDELAKGKESGNAGFDNKKDYFQHHRDLGTLDQVVLAAELYILKDGENRHAVADVFIGDESYRRPGSNHNEADIWRGHMQDDYL